MDELIQEITTLLRESTVIDLKVIREFVKGYLGGRHING